MVIVKSPLGWWLFLSARSTSWSCPETQRRVERWCPWRGSWRVPCPACCRGFHHNTWISCDEWWDFHGFYMVYGISDGNLYDFIRIWVWTIDLFYSFLGESGFGGDLSPIQGYWIMRKMMLNHHIWSYQILRQTNFWFPFLCLGDEIHLILNHCYLPASKHTKTYGKSMVISLGNDLHMVYFPSGKRNTACTRCVTIGMGDSPWFCGDAMFKHE